jgi:hypothetical protein
MSTLPLFDKADPSFAPIDLLTPIASALSAHFADGGSIEDAVRLVERMERANLRLPVAKQSSQSASARGTRLPVNWQPSQEEVLFAKSRHMPVPMIENEVEKFRNYWVAKSGASATKRDWSATWRNWIINAMERANGSTRIPNVQATSQGNAYARIAMRLRQSPGK